MNGKEISRILQQYIEDDDQNYFYVISTNDTDIKVTHKNTHGKLIQFLHDELKIDLETCLLIDRNIDEILNKLEEE